MIKNSNIKQQERRLTLEDLCKRREQEEEVISTRFLSIPVFECVLFNFVILMIYYF